MKLVAARTGDHIDDPAGGAAELSRIPVSGDLEFFDPILGIGDHLASAVEVAVGEAIDNEIVGESALPAH